MNPRIFKSSEDKDDEWRLGGMKYPSHLQGAFCIPSEELSVAASSAYFQGGEFCSENPPEKGMATYSSILAWRAPWTEEPGGLQSMESQRVRHN